MMRKIYPTGSKGFTLIEILVALLVLTVGFSQLFLIFLESASAVRHVGNRMAAVVFMENAAWEARERWRLAAFNEVYRYENTVTNGAQSFDITAEAKKIPGFQRLYNLEVKASWNEGKKEISMRRENLIRRR